MRTVNDMQKRQSKRLPTAELLPSGAYRCRVLVNGKRESFTASTASEAQEMALLAKIGMPKKKYSKRTVGQAIDDYIKSREAVLSPSTIRGYKIIRKNRMQSVMDRTIDSMNQIAWQQAINDEAKAGINAKYIRNIWGLIRPALEIETGSAPSVRLPQRIKNPRPFLDDREVKIFLDAIRGDTAELASLFALHSLRRSEIMALTWNDIDLKNKTISVNGAMVIGEGNKKVLKRKQRRIPPGAPSLSSYRDYLISLILWNRIPGQLSILKTRLFTSISIRYARRTVSRRLVSMAFGTHSQVLGSIWGSLRKRCRKWEDGQTSVS